MNLELGDIISIPLYTASIILLATIVLDLSNFISNIEFLASSLESRLNNELTLLNSIAIMFFGLMYGFSKVFEVIGMIRKYFNPSSEVGK